MAKVKNTNFENERVSSSPKMNDAAFTIAVEKTIELNDEINSDIDKLTDLKTKIVCEIEQLSEAKYIDVLYKRYVQFKRFYEISDEMSYSLGHAKKIHRKALKEFAKVILNDTF